MSARSQLTRVVALGDSLSCGEGVGIHVQPGQTWVALLADALPGGSLHQLSVAGARVRDVLNHQLPGAMGQRPDLATVLVGLNDIIRTGFHPDRFRADLAEIVMGLRAADACVLLAIPATAGRPARIKWIVTCGVPWLVQHGVERALPAAAFLGFQRGRALWEAVASLDVFVHTGIDETFCRSIQEALASGVPVLAPARGGPLDLVHHGDNGWLWPAEEPSVLREQVRALAEDPMGLSTMRLRARASVLGRSWELIGDELLGHYARVVRDRSEAMQPAA